MNGSHAYLRSTTRTASLTENGELFTPQSEAFVPGSFNDEHIIRGIVTKAIKASSKSRQAIADEMSELLGTEVTLRALDSYTSESAKQNRWPAQYTRAFCAVTGDWSLFHCVAERAGLHVISKSERKLMELGRQILLQQRATEAIAKLQADLAGVAL